LSHLFPGAGRFSDTAHNWKVVINTSSFFVFLQSSSLCSRCSWPYFTPINSNRRRFTFWLHLGKARKTSLFVIKVHLQVLWSIKLLCSIEQTHSSWLQHNWFRAGGRGPLQCPPQRSLGLCFWDDRHSIPSRSMWVTKMSP
jgi:hypothetical protein